MSRTPHDNRPGLAALRYRLDTHGGFFARMVATLPNQAVPDDPSRRPLRSLTARTPDDPTMALLDAWAVVTDVLCFYQERIVNEGFLRTATERRSVLELARAIGYELNPGVAASTWVAFEVDTARGTPGFATVPEGTRLLSVPGQDQRPQPFETAETIEARAAWNAMRPRLTRAQSLGRDATEIRLEGVATGLRPGDPLLLVGSEREAFAGSERWDLRLATTVEPDRPTVTTRVLVSPGLGHYQPDSLPPADPRAFAFRQRAHLFGHAAPDWDTLPEPSKRDVLGLSPEVFAVALRDGRALTGSADHTVRIWDTATGKELHVLAGHTAPVRAVAWRPESEQALSGGADRALIVWNGAAELDRKPHSATITAIACASDGKLAAVGCSDGSLSLWNLATRTQIGAQFIAHQGGVAAITFWNGFVVTGGDGGRVRIWKTDGTRPHLLEFRPHLAGDITALAVAGDHLASGSTDRTIALVELKLDAQGKPTYTTLGGAPAKDTFVVEEITGIAYDHLKQHVHVAEAGGSLRTWSWKQGYEVAIHGGHAGRVHAVALSSDGTTLVSGGADGTAKVWSAPLAPASKQPRLVSRERLTFTGHERVVGHGEWPGFAVPTPAPGQDRYVDLDAEYPAILPGSWIALVKPSYAEVYRVKDVRVVQRNDFRLGGRVTRLFLTGEHLHYFGLRETTVYVQSEPLELPPVPDPTPIKDQDIALETFVPGLKPGQAVLVTGRRARARVTAQNRTLTLVLAGGATQDLERGENLLVIAPAPPLDPAQQKTGEVWRLRRRSGAEGLLECRPGELEYAASDPRDEFVSEPAVLDQVTAAGESRPTELRLTQRLARAYDRATVTLCANAVRVSHGETIRDEVLGSGNGAVANQRFSLGRVPLTYVRAPTQPGGRAELTVRVGGVRWDEVPSLYQIAPEREVYTVRRRHDGRTQVIFGDGRSGARLPSGQENVSATYRVGIGPEGEVAAGAITLMQTRPFGIKAVVNPIPAAGAADPEPLAEARHNAPLTVLTFDRLVSVQDYEDFCRAFAGVGAARATALWKGNRRILHVTLADLHGDPVEGTQLYTDLLAAIRQRCDPVQVVTLQSEPAMKFRLKAEVFVDPRHVAADVLAQVRAALRAAFSFPRRGFGQDVSTAEVVTVMHGVPGVVAVDLDELCRVDDAAPGKADLVSLIEAHLARFEGDKPRAAELLVIDLAEPGSIELSPTIARSEP